ncbi:MULTISPECIES: sensor histidine kinase [unclassified Sphingobacterium]|uniref:sensor histidine kinase n=1 Tax=unclassified Sphingobacterium TaxID=2609468 RepID=UPI0025D1B242|nr:MULTISPECIES: HAMP domain-containing sensor histidine kinase [unclassified Sphingobacterium]
MQLTTKIRILLLILTISFMGTALTIHLTITDKDMLELDKNELTANIHKKESIIEDLFADSTIMKTFKNVEQFPLQSADILEKFASEKGVFLYLYKDSKPVLWSTDVYVPVTDAGLKSNTTYMIENNRSFVVKKKTAGDVNILALVLVKRLFNSNNEYLKNTFNKQLIDDSNLEIADYTDIQNIQNVYSKDGTYLFSVKLKSGKHDNVFIFLQFICWVSAMFCFIILTHNICLNLAKKGFAWLGVFIFVSVLSSLRFIDLQSNWLAMHSSLGIFDPKYYAYNSVFPNLWALTLTNLSCLWCLAFIHSVSDKLILPPQLKKKIIPYLISGLLVFSIYFFYNLLFKHLGSLITHTSIVSYDFSKIADLSKYSWLNLFNLCLAILSLFFYIDILLRLIDQLFEQVSIKLNIQLAVLIFSMIVYALLGENSINNVLLGILILLIFLRKYALGQYRFSFYIVILVIVALFSSINHDKYMKIKKLESMKLVLSNLEAEDDTNAISLFMDIEKSMKNDEQLQHLFRLSANQQNAIEITDFIKKKYLSGYLSKFDFNGYYYANNIPLDNYPNNKFEEYREKVINNSIKVTESFYRVKSELGTHEYFMTLNLPLGDNTTANIFLNLKNRAFSYILPYPEILSDSRTTSLQQESFLNNSFALYKDKQLVTQYGKYTYPSADSKFPDKVGKFIEIDEPGDYFHLMYRPDSHTTLVISRANQNFYDYLAVTCFFFVLLFVFFSIVDIVIYLIQTMTQKSFRLKSIKYHFMILKNTIQYSTRIQTIFIVSIIFAILISGALAFYNINSRLSHERENNRIKYIAEVSRKLENMMNSAESMNSKETVESYLNILSQAMTTDFTLFNRNGRLIYSSQPKIYDLKLFSTFINPTAYKKLSLIKKTETIEPERVGDFEFSSSYASIRNADYQIAYYLNIPYFASKKEESTSINLLLNTLINIYTIIIIAFGFFAVYISNKITAPLVMIGKKLSQTNVGKQNEPLFWQRNDEVGALVKEYNFMLIKLEENSKKLMGIEREAAWREMAKQIAHEIKNPLTPMKLGIQQLSRSYKENDPRFEERFNRISTSFIEQIDSLSHIASEFSAFAKLPDTRFEKVNIIQKINKSVSFYSTNTQAKITVTNHADSNEIFVLGDKDQLLRTFNNLIKNAIEAGLGRRKLKIDFEIYANPNEMVEIHITDNGNGISDEALPKIFQANFTTKSSGTGLGLAFVKQTIEGMRGTINFKTTQGKGTVFIIHIPFYHTMIKDI